MSKIRKGAVDFDTDKLAADVEAAFDAYPEEKIDLMWGTLEYIYKAILEYMGGNTYPLHSVDDGDF